MYTNTIGPYQGYQRSIPDSFFIGFDANSLLLTRQIPVDTSNSSDPLSPYEYVPRLKALWVFPIVLQPGQGLAFQRSVPHGEEGIQYTRFNFGTDIGPRGIESTGLPSPVRQNSDSALAGFGSYIAGLDMFGVSTFILRTIPQV